MRKSKSWCSFALENEDRLTFNAIMFNDSFLFVLDCIAYLCYNKVFN